MSIGSWDLQVALLDILRGAGIAGGRVYDQDSAVPSNVTFPYVGLGETQTTNLDVEGRAGSDEDLTIHIWDRANFAGGQRGQKNVKEIADQIHERLNGKRIDVNNRSAAAAFVAGFHTLGDPDPLTSHGIVSLHVAHFGQKEI